MDVVLVLVLVVVVVVVLILYTLYVIYDIYIPESSNNKNILVVPDFKSFLHKSIELIEPTFFSPFWKVSSRSFWEISIPNSYQWIFSNWRMYNPKTFCMVLVDAKSG